MAFICLVVEVSDSIEQLNSDVQRPGKPHEAVVNARNMMDALLAGAKDGSVQITTRDSDPSIGTSGSNSQQEDYDLN